MSENTNSRTPKLVGKSFFFTEPDKVEQSTNLSDSHAFGPMGTTDVQKAASFRLGAKMKLKAEVPNAKAFAICSGNVLLQPQSGNSSKVNLILRPMVQPFNAMPIKYFIYRGLDKADFLANETTLALTGLEFLTQVRSDFASLNNVPVASEMLSKWIGYELGATPDTDLIDDMFFRISDPSTDDDPVNAKKDELPFVREGVHLGHFSGDFQLDIVLGSPDYKPLVSTTGFLHNITFARAAEGIIAVAGKPSNYPEKAYREAILDFIDPAAFWGMHCADGSYIQLYEGASGAWLIRSGYELFETVHGLFVDEKLYISITSEFSRSYCYYKENCPFRAEIVNELGEVQTTLDTFQNSNWPICIIPLSSGIAIQDLALRIFIESNKYKALVKEYLFKETDKKIERIRNCKSSDNSANCGPFNIGLINLTNVDIVVRSSQYIKFELLRSTFEDVSIDFDCFNLLNEFRTICKLFKPEGKFVSSKAKYLNVLDSSKVVCDQHGNIILAQVVVSNYLKSNEDFNIEPDSFLHVQFLPVMIETISPNIKSNLAYLREPITVTSQSSDSEPIRKDRFSSRFIPRTLKSGVEITTMDRVYGNGIDLSISSFSINLSEYQLFLDTSVGQNLVNPLLVNSGIITNVDAIGNIFQLSFLTLIAENLDGKMHCVPNVSRILLSSTDFQNFYSNNIQINII